MAFAWGVALALAWGFSAFLVRLVVGEVGPQRVTIWLQLVGTAFLACVTPWPSVRGVSGVALSFALATTCFGWMGLVALYEGLRVGRTGVVLALAACGPLVPIVLGAVTGEALSPGRWLWVGLTFAGIAVLTVARSEGNSPATLSALWGLGNLVLGGLSLFCFRQAVALSDPPTGLLTIKGSGVLLYGSLVLLSLVRARSWKPIRFSGRVWLGLVAAGACDGVAAAALANGYALAGGTALVSALGALYPCVTALLVRLVVGERLSPAQLAGMALALGGGVGLSLG